MPLWDSARAQVDLLKSASDIDPDADCIFYHDISSNIIFRELAREARGLQSFSMPLSANTVSAPASTTLAFRSLRFPFRFRLRAVSVTYEYAVSTGIIGVSVDVLNSGRSVLSGTAGAAANRLAAPINAYFASVAVAASMELINQYDRIDYFIAGNQGGARAPIVHLIGFRE